MYKVFILLMVLLFVGCAKSLDLGIGKYPTPPVKSKKVDAQKRVSLVQGPDLSQKLMPPSTKAKGQQKYKQYTRMPLLGSSGLSGVASDSLSIMSPEGGVLTLWALNVGNWVWGYSLIDSLDFGEARIWRIFTKANGSVTIQNTKQNTCLSAYKNGVIHSYCNMDDPSQLWTFNLFDNQAVQIQNVATKQCLQTPSNQATRFFSIFLTDCVRSNTLNSDQQWFIIAPPVNAGLVFSIENN